MKKLTALLVIAMMGLVGCDNNTNPPTPPTTMPTPIVTIDPSPTQEDSPSPTPDTSWWSKDCLAEGEGALVSDNACLSGRLADNQYGRIQERPMRFEVVFSDVRDTPIQGTEVWWEGGLFRTNVTFYHGKVGYSFWVNNPGLACHKFIIDGVSTINLMNSTNPANAALNFSIDVMAYADGEEYVVGQAAIANEWRDGFDQPHWEFNGDRHWEMPFYFSEEHEAVQFRVYFASIWDLANHGSTWGWDKIGVFRQSGFSDCDGVIGL
jgi:hypothetical protein